MESAVTKSDHAYEAVRERILSGEFEPGSVVNQEKLAEAIGVSTTPLREALRRLKAEGFVELGAHRDARITALGPEEARDLFEVRRALDPLAASLAAERRTKADIAEMREAATKLAPLRANPYATQLAAHRRFHAAIYRASHNDLLISTLEGLWDRADRYRRYMLRKDPEPASRARRSEEHERLLGHVLAGDAEEAAALMAEHVDTSLGAQALAQLAQAHR